MQRFLQTLFLISLSFFLCYSQAAIASSAANQLDTTTVRGVTILSGNLHGTDWLEASAEAKLAFCNQAFAAFRASPSQSYIISSNVQSLSPQGLCSRLDQYFSVEENLETRLGAAAAIAPLLFADTPLGTKYHLTDK